MEIILRNISKQLGTTMVLDAVSMQLLSGKIYGFQGINGSGKTMLMRAISGLIHPTSGEVVIDGKILGGQNSFPQNMGLLIETPSFLGSYSGFDNLKMLASLSDTTLTDTDIINVLSRVGLCESSRVKYKKYSLGMRQRLGIACAIMESPALLILDEPFNSLDQDGIEKVQKIIKEEKERGALIIVACHDYDLLHSVSDEIFKIVAGKITAHTIKNEADNFVEV